jgi:hypothetical protein
LKPVIEINAFNKAKAEGAGQPAQRSYDYACTFSKAHTRKTPIVNKRNLHERKQRT